MEPEPTEGEETETRGPRLALGELTRSYRLFGQPE